MKNFTAKHNVPFSFCFIYATYRSCNETTRDRTFTSDTIGDRDFAIAVARIRKEPPTVTSGQLQINCLACYVAPYHGIQAILLCTISSNDMPILLPVFLDIPCTGIRLANDESNVGRPTGMYYECRQAIAVELRFIVVKMIYIDEIVHYKTTF